jgi:hypothetical protein
MRKREMADPESEANHSVLHGTLTKARERTSVEIDSLLNKLTNYKSAMSSIKQSVVGERSYADMVFDHVQHPERMVAVKNMTTDALRQTADGWKETAPWHGANVEDAPERPH